jgi:hypothetical protein
VSLDCLANESSDSSTSLAAQDNGSFLEAAAEHLRRGAPPNKKHAQDETRETARQIELLRAWASEKGCVISPERLSEFRLVSEGTSEHKVFFDPARNRAIKQTLPGQFGWFPKLDHSRWTLGIATPLDYLERWILFNIIFADDVRLEGVTLQGGTIIIGQKTEPLSLIISQRWHPADDPNHPAPTETEISMFLHKLGFYPLPNSFYGWQRPEDGIVILDARPDNFIKTRDGIAPIDLPLTRKH